MKHLKKTIKTLLYLTIRIFFPIIPIRRGLVLCRSFNGLQYGGNVKYLSDYLTTHCGQYTIVWNKNNATKAIFPNNINTVKINSIKGIILLNIAEFIISDFRINAKAELWHKRKGQKYIMTWHGGIGNKKIEGDAINELPETYINNAKEDSKNADLFISCSKFLSKIYRRAFWYKGEILEKGMPAYDVFFKDIDVRQYWKTVRESLGIGLDDYVLVYAPTFRKDHSIEPYKIDWSKIINVLEKKYNNKVFVLLKLHPGLITENVDISELINHHNVIDVTNYGDIIPLMCAANIMISDYSSTIFEFALLNRPAYIYAPDYEEYDRGFYFSITNLPFPFSANEDALLTNLQNTDIDTYIEGVNAFYNNTLGVIRNDNSCKDIEMWMNNHLLRK